MSDTTTNPYERPSARFTDSLSPTRSGNGKLEVRASALGQCRRRLWYAATEQLVTNPTSPETQLIFDAGNALEPVVVRAMQRDGWTVCPVDRESPTAVSVELGESLIVSGHPDATGRLPDNSVDSIDSFLFDDASASDSEELVIEVKTRGPEAFKRWQTLGAERSHPDSVAQVACYSLGLFGEFRDVVIATLDTGSRKWDYELIPAERVERAWNRAADWLGELTDHLDANLDSPPERDFDASDWHCRGCPYLDICQQVNESKPGDVQPVEEPTWTVSDEEAQSALWRYEELSELSKSLNTDKRESLDTLERWLKARGSTKAQLDGRDKPRAIGKVTSKRYKVDHKRLNKLLDPEQRAEVVTESRSEYLRVN